MINSKVLDFNKEQLVYWLRHIAGSSNPDYFNAAKIGGMKLQQIPEEYAELLLILKSFGAEDYLALGIGNGGSFAMECLFMSEKLKNAVAVDNLYYGDLIQQNEHEVLMHIKDVHKYCNPECKIHFKNMSTSDFFLELGNEAQKQFPSGPVLFDVGFVDADHSYEGVKADYLNMRKHIRKTGLIIFHDINSTACPGIKQIWQELRNLPTWHREIIHSDTCGIGIIQM